MRCHGRAVEHCKGPGARQIRAVPKSAVRQMEGARAGGADMRCAAASKLTRKDVAGETGFIPLPRQLAPSCGALLLRSSGQAGLATLLCSSAPGTCTSFCQLGVC